MKIAIINNMQPFINSVTEIHAENLKNKLTEYGHDAQVIRIPFSWNSLENLLDGIMSAKLTKIVNIDMMIGLCFPSYMIPYENKKLWLLQNFGQLFNFNNTNEQENELKNIILNTNIEFLKQFDGRIFTISQSITEKLKKYYNIESIPLYPPILNKNNFYSEGTGDYIFCPGNINISNRQYLLVEAMKYTKSNVKLILAGKGKTIQDENNIFNLIEKYNVKEKVKYINYPISDKEKNDLYSNCLCVGFIPIDEDYGYTVIEAFRSSKPVISCYDSGCPAIFILHEHCGFTVNPDAYELAIVMDRLFQNKKYAVDLGINAKIRYKELDINWEKIIERLIQ